MTDDDREFFIREKKRFEELLEKLGWTRESLFQTQRPLVQCPFDKNHYFPVGSKHAEVCQLTREGFSRNYQQEKVLCDNENRLLDQPVISMKPSQLGEIIGRPIPVTKDFPLNVDQINVFCSPKERALIEQTIRDEAVRLKLMPKEPTPFIGTVPTEPRDVDNRIENFKKNARKSLYDITREIIDTGMQSISQATNIDSNQPDSDLQKLSKRRDGKQRHRSSSSTLSNKKKQKKKKKKNKKKKTTHHDHHHKKHRKRSDRSRSPSINKIDHRQSKRKRID